MSTGDDKSTFLAAIQSSLDAATFVRITLGKYRGPGEAQKVIVTPVTLKGERKLKFVISLARKDDTQNYAIDDAIALLASRIGEEFLSATLFTTVEDLTISYTKKRATHLARGKPTFSSAPETGHNRAKQYMIDPGRPYLKALGITDASGSIKPSMYPKFKQICHFVEITDDLIRDSDVAGATTISAVDIGSGKGYLTFALYDYLSTTLGATADVTGIEMRIDLVKFCADLARNSGFSGLKFEASKAHQARLVHPDIMIALHACDTATDDAIYQGICANALLIITAPCCQHELAPQLANADEAITGLTKFGLFKQRQADLITDAARCLLLEASGYKVKVIEFVSTEHTAKNILIAGIRAANVDRVGARKQYEGLKALAGFKTQHLEVLLAERDGSKR